MNDQEIQNKASSLRAAIRRCKAVYVMNPLTEGYIKVYKNDLLADIQSWTDDMEANDDLYIRISDNNLYIN